MSERSGRVRIEAVGNKRRDLRVHREDRAGTRLGLIRREIGRYYFHASDRVSEAEHAYIDDFLREQNRERAS